MADSLIYPDVEIVDIIVMEEADDGLAPPPDPGKPSPSAHAMRCETELTHPQRHSPRTTTQHPQSHPGPPTAPTTASAPSCL